MGDIARLKARWNSTLPHRDNPAERSPESVAMTLRNSRILQGYNLREIAGALNIRQAHLEALEENRFGDLPPLVYAQGFVAAYASFLHLNRNEMVARFREEAMGAPVPPPALVPFNLNTKPDAEQRHTPSLAVIFAGLVLIMLVYGLWQALRPDGREAVLAVPPLPVIEAPAESLSETPAPVQPTTPAPAPAAQNIVKLYATTETAFELRNSRGDRLASVVLQPGQSYSLPPGTASWSLVSRDLPNLTITVDGQQVRLPVLPAHQLSQLQLDPQRLLGITAPGK